jgi:hypothetical protein
MLIIGCDYHPAFEQIAYVDTATGDCGERRLEHREETEKFYRDLAAHLVSPPCPSPFVSVLMTTHYVPRTWPYGEQNTNLLCRAMDEGRKRVIGIMAARPSLWFWATVTRRAAWQGSAIRMTIVAF